MDKYEGAFNTLLQSDDNNSNQYEGCLLYTSDAADE